MLMVVLVVAGLVLLPEAASGEQLANHALIAPSLVPSGWLQLSGGQVDLHLLSTQRSGQLQIVDLEYWAALIPASAQKVRP